MGGRDLAETQRFVVDALRLETPLTALPQMVDAASGLLAPSARGMTPVERLEVYRDQFWIRHLANLFDDYPTLAWAAGGAEAFRALASEYLRRHPPRTWDLQRLGADVPAFVDVHPRLAGDLVARDAARLDWAFMEIFDAPDAPPFDPGVLAAVPEDAWPGARVVLHPALRLLALEHPVHEVRDELKSGASAPPRPSRAPVRIAVWRDGACYPRSCPVEPLAHDLLEALGRQPLGAACESVARASGLGEDALGERVGAWFREWTQRGWVSAVRFEGGS